jgi:hypothetical protein
MEEFDIDIVHCPLSIVQESNMAMLMALQGYIKEWVMFQKMMIFQMPQ